MRPGPTSGWCQWQATSLSDVLLEGQVFQPNLLASGPAHPRLKRVGGCGGDSLENFSGIFLKVSSKRKGPGEEGRMLPPKSFSQKGQNGALILSRGVIGKSALEIGQFLRRNFWGPLSLPAPLFYCWERSERNHQDGIYPTTWETEIQTMFLDHGLRPGFEPLFKVSSEISPLKRQSGLVWVFWSVIKGIPRGRGRSCLGEEHAVTAIHKTPAIQEESGSAVTINVHIVGVLHHITTRKLHREASHADLSPSSWSSKPLNRKHWVSSISPEGVLWCPRFVMTGVHEVEMLGSSEQHWSCYATYRYPLEWQLVRETKCKRVRFEGQSFGSSFAPYFLVGEERAWIHTGDSPFGRRGAKAPQNGSHNLVPVWFLYRSK